jgi:hypothetical protein
MSRSNIFFSSFFYTKQLYTIVLFISVGGKRLKHSYIIDTGRVALVFFLCMSIICSSCFSGVVGGIARGSDSIPITVNVYGQGRSHSKAVTLTNTQYDALVRYFDAVQERFDAASNKEEFRVVCNEVIAELDTYGLLPEGMSRLQAQRLISGSYLPSANRGYELAEQLWKENHRSSGDVSQVRKNMLCAVFAMASKLSEYPEEPVILPVGVLLFLGLAPAFLASFFGQMELADNLAELGLFLWMLNPFRWFNYVWIDGYEINIRSIGVLGLVHETLSNRGLLTGFTGLMLSPFNNRTIFLGAAFGVFDLG